MLTFFIKCAIHLPPFAVVFFLFNWHFVENFLRKQAAKELSREFGTEDVAVQSVKLWMAKGAVVCEIKNSRVGEDFLRVGLVRVTAASLRAFLTLPGPQKLRWQCR